MTEAERSSPGRPARAVIDGSAFDDLAGFHDEIRRRLCPDFDGYGRNTDALVDVLRGGFGACGTDQPIEITWLDADRSRRRLDHAALAGSLSEALTRVHPTNRDRFVRELAAAQGGHGPTLFDVLANAIRSVPGVTLVLA